MSSKSKIEWTEATWNPVTGCTKVSPGCAHCYAERITNRFGGPGAFEKVVLHPDRLELPLHWRKPRMIFVNSMSDLFHEAVSEDFIASVFSIMAGCPQHTFQVLTKRADRMKSWLEYIEQGFQGRGRANTRLDALEGEWPLPNVWLGVSVENQRMADQRIPLLLQTPATVRFVSAEPLLGPVNLCAWLQKCVREWAGDEFIHADGLDWVIVGGESGPKARPMHPEWPIALRDQCVEAGVPLFFKQWGEWARAEVYPGGDLGGEMRRGTVRILHAPGNPEGYFRRGDAMVRRLGKKAAGRLLGGQEWNQMPVGAT